MRLFTGLTTISMSRYGPLLEVRGCVDNQTIQDLYSQKYKPSIFNAEMLFNCTNTL